MGKQVMGFGGSEVWGIMGKNHREPRNERSGHWSLRTRGHNVKGVEDMRASGEGNQR